MISQPCRYLTAGSRKFNSGRLCDSGREACPQASESGLFSGGLRTSLPTLSASRSGFTIVEVILSLSLFVVAAAVFASSYVNVITSFETVQVDQAYEQDMTMIRQAALMIQDTQELEEGGEVPTGSHGLASWKVEYEPTLIADLFKVKLLVVLNPTNEEGEEEPREVEETYYLTRPTWSEPSEREILRADSRDRLLEQQAMLQ